MAESTGSDCTGSPTLDRGSDHLTLALRVGLHNHPQFAGAIHQRVIAEVLYEAQLGYLTIGDIKRAVQQRFDGLTLSSGSTKSALEALRREMFVDELRHGSRDAEATYALSASGQAAYSTARTDGNALLKRVRAEFGRQLDITDERILDARWAGVLTALDRALRESAYDIAISLIDGAHLPYVGTKDNEAGADLSIFLQRATGDALVFLRRAVQGSLGYYLFRAAPDADAQVRRHLENRTFYLDTTVLYSLATDEPEFRELRDDLLRLAGSLRCRLKVVRATIREFQSSVRFHKRLVRERGPMSRPIAIAVLTGNVADSLDDFSRGFYRALAGDQSMTLDLFAQRCELIEEDLQRWGITVVDDPADEADLGVEELQSSLQRYLEAHPRARSPDGPRDEAVHHDALLVALVRRERAHRGIAVATRPSQVGTWFLTRDRRVRRWDAENVRNSGATRIPHCIALDEWIESMMLFDTNLNVNESACSAIVRLIAQNAPPLTSDEMPHARDLLEIGREAESLKLHSVEAARLAADKQLLRTLSLEDTPSRRVDAIQAAALANKEVQIDALEDQIVDLGDQLEEVGAQHRTSEQELSALRAQSASREAKVMEVRKQRRAQRLRDAKEKNALKQRIDSIETADRIRRVRSFFFWTRVFPGIAVFASLGWWAIASNAPGAVYVDWRLRVPLAAAVFWICAVIIERTGREVPELSGWWSYDIFRGAKAVLATILFGVLCGVISNVVTRGAEAQQERAHAVVPSAEIHRQVPDGR